MMQRRVTLYLSKREEINYKSEVEENHTMQHVQHFESPVWEDDSDLGN